MFASVPSAPSKGPLAPDLILMLLAADDRRNGLDGITRLEKLLFLADRETDISKNIQDPFEFTPYNFGPYSKAVYEAVELLEELDLLREERSLDGASLDEMEEITAALDEQEGVERRFLLTDKGRAVAQLLKNRHPDVGEQLATIRKKYGGLALRRLIRDVYAKYPEMAVASVIRDSI